MKTASRVCGIAATVAGNSFRSEWRNPIGLGIDIFRCLDAYRPEVLGKIWASDAAERADQQQRATAARDIGRCR
jgi:hypothetical protein